MIPAIATAATPEATAVSRFNEGKAAFEAQDFPRALQLFEQSVALGMQGPAVHYNIGVSAYRSGDFARAERAFHEVARAPAMATLAYYNLGLVAQQRNDSHAARDWFERARSQSTDERVTQLANRQLDAIPAEPLPAWSAYARGGLGYDDNVALRSQSIDTPGTGESDSFAVLLAAGSYTFQEHWRIDAAAGLSRYAKLDEFDQTALSVGGTREFSIEGWSIDVGANATRLSLGGDVYEQSLTASALAKRPIGPGTLRAQLQISTVDGENDFSGLSGSRTGGGVEYDWAAIQALTFTAHLRAESNDSEEDLFATRWTEGGLAAHWAYSPTWSFEAGARMRQTRHPAPSAEESAFNDRRTTIRLEATKLLWRQVNLIVRYEHEQASSTVDAYEYDRNWVVVSIETWR